jgi:tRNA-specific 2-thiouridylase
LGIGGVKGKQREDGTADAWYAARKDLATNTLYVVQGHDHPWLLQSELKAEQTSWVAGHPPALGPIHAKTRYRQADAACTILAAEGDSLSLHFDQPQWAVTPGQSVVLYDGDRCLGGGIIQ